MKAKQIVALIALVFISLVLVLTSCQKEVSGGNTAIPAGRQQVALYMNDDPANYFKVMIDIQRVELKIDTCSHQHDDRFYADDDDKDDDHHGHDDYGQWDTLDIKPGVYDLLRLRNGVDTLLAKGFPFKGRISKIRITLGTGSTVWIDSTTSFPLSICDNKPYAYVKTMANTIDTLAGGLIKMRMDFDIAKSIKFKNGTYCLKPSIKSYSEHQTGEIEGKVLPKDAKVMVTVFNATDTAYALPSHEGEYKIRGLKAGTYSVYFDADAPYTDTTISSITIVKGEDTKLPTITLKK